MNKVLIVSKSCSTGKGKPYITDRLAAAGIEAAFGSLADHRNSLGEYRGIVVGMDPFGEKELELTPNLRFIMKYGVGIENIDAAAAKRRGVRVFNMPGVNTDSVAEMAFALMIGAARRVAEGDRLIRAGQWPRVMGRTLIGKILGLIGTGAIGRRLAELTAGFGMTVLGCDPFPNDAFTALGGVYLPLEDLLAAADVVSIHAPLTSDTRHMIGATQLARMKPGAILVNTARGPVVDEEALRLALETGSIFAAGLDVFESEPAFGSSIAKLDNVVVTPHIAASSLETMEHMDETCIETIILELSS